MFDGRKMRISNTWGGKGDLFEKLGAGECKQNEPCFGVSLLVIIEQQCFIRVDVQLLLQQTQVAVDLLANFEELHLLGLQILVVERGS